VEPQDYENLTRHLAELDWLSLQWIAEQDPTRTRLLRVLEQDGPSSRWTLRPCGTSAPHWQHAPPRPTARTPDQERIGDA
jgi:hypothetical protein